MSRRRISPPRPVCRWVTYQFMLAKCCGSSDTAPETGARRPLLCHQRLSDAAPDGPTRHRGRRGRTDGAGRYPPVPVVARDVARFELPESYLSDVVRAGTDLGPITAEAARRFGLPPACRCVVGCLDQYAGAIGVGNVEPGMISETTGTVLSTVECADRFARRPAPRCFRGPRSARGCTGGWPSATSRPTCCNGIAINCPIGPTSSS